MTTGQSLKPCFSQGKTRSGWKPQGLRTGGVPTATFPRRQMVSSSGLASTQFTTPVSQTAMGMLPPPPNTEPTDHPTAPLCTSGNSWGRKSSRQWYYHNYKVNTNWGRSSGPHTRTEEAGKEASHLPGRQGLSHVKAQQFPCVTATKQPSAPALPAGARELLQLTCTIPGSTASLSEGMGKVSQSLLFKTPMADHIC